MREEVREGEREDGNKEGNKEGRKKSTFVIQHLGTLELCVMYLGFKKDMYMHAAA